MFKRTDCRRIVDFLLSLSLSNTSKAVIAFLFLICSRWSPFFKLCVTLWSISICWSPVGTKHDLSLKFTCNPQSINVLSIKAMMMLKKNSTNTCPSSRSWILNVSEKWRTESTDLIILQNKIKKTFLELNTVDQGIFRKYHET